MKYKRWERTRRERRGAAFLLVAVFAAFTSMASMYVIHTLSQAGERLARVRRGSIEAEYLSRAAVKAGEDALRSALQRDAVPPPTGTYTIDGIDVPYDIVLDVAPFEDVDENGIRSNLSVYRISANATVDNVRADSKRIVAAREIPVFQFGLFYEDEMELYANTATRINGPVLCNSDMYLTAGAGGLVFDTNYVRAAGEIFHYAKETGLPGSQGVGYRRWVVDPMDATEPMEIVEAETQAFLAGLGIASGAGGFDSEFLGHDSDGDGDFYGPNDWLPWAARVDDIFAEPDTYLDGHGVTVQTASHGARPMPSLGAREIAMFVEQAGGDYDFNPATQEYEPTAPGTGTHAKGPLHAEAAISIISYANGTWKAFDENDFDITANLQNSVGISSLYDATQAEGGAAKTPVILVDLGRLRADGHFPANGVFYLGAYGASTGTNAKGFQFMNGNELTGPVTIASENSIYLQGDFNTIRKKPAAVVADHVSLLSNAWDGTKAAGALPPASETTYNVAIFTGQRPSDVAHNGGVRGLLGLHEDWSAPLPIPLHVLGSLVCAHDSQYATSPHVVGGDAYLPPLYDVQFDPNLRTIANQPPEAPMAIDLQPVVWW